MKSNHRPDASEREATSNLRSGLFKLLAFLVGIAVLLSLASLFLHLYNTLSRDGEDDTSLSPSQTLPSAADPSAATLAKNDHGDILPPVVDAPQPSEEAGTGLPEISETEANLPIALASLAASQTGPCRQHLKRLISQDGPVRRSEEFVFLLDDTGEVAQTWYLGVSEGRLNRGRLAHVVAHIPCFRDWRLPTVAEFRDFQSRLDRGPRETPPLPEGLWTSDDDGLGTEWKVFFPSQKHSQFFGDAHVWWLAAVTESLVTSEQHPEVVSDPQ